MQRAEAPNRSRQLDDIAEALPRRAGTLSRLFISHTSFGLSRTELSVIWAVADYPRRITELAAREGLTQPAITRLVNRLADCGWVEREADPDDGRAVLVHLTQAGRELVMRLRAEYRAMLHEEMATLPDADVDTLARAIDVLDVLIERLSERGP